MAPNQKTQPVAEGVSPLQRVKSRLQSLLPASWREDLWYIRHTGRLSRDYQPRRYSYSDWLPSLTDDYIASLPIAVEGSAVAMPPAGTTAIIVLSYRNLPYTRMTLESLLRVTTGSDYTVYVVDNGSDEDVRGYLSSLAARTTRIKPIFNQENRGFAAANNQGIEAAQAAHSDYIVLLNNDTIVTEGWLSALISHLQDKKVGAVGPVTNFIGDEAEIAVPYQTLDGIAPFARRYTARHRGDALRVPFLAMFCLALRREVVDQIGPLDERFGRGYFEDDDYAWRLQEAGYHLLCARDAFVHHFGGATFSREGRAQARAQFDRNRHLLEEKWQRAWVPHRTRRGLINTFYFAWHDRQSQR